MVVNNSASRHDILDVCVRELDTFGAYQLLLTIRIKWKVWVLEGLVEMEVF